MPPVGILRCCESKCVFSMEISDRKHNNDYLEHVKAYITVRLYTI